MPTTARIDGNWGFGFVVTEKAMRMAIEKAHAHGVSAITVFHQSHIGRLGDYPEMAAAEGMIGLITADSGAGPKAVAPFGGRERRLGTNPLAIAVPSDLEGPLLLDTPPAKGFSEVLYPGEMEWRTEQQRWQEGIYIEGETWEQISALVNAHGLEGAIGGP